MQRTTMIISILAAVVLALAAWIAALKPNVKILTHAHQHKNCKGKDCDVHIKFNCVDTSDPTTCESYPDYEVIVVNPKYKINFMIDDANYEFADNGIHFVDEPIKCTRDNKRKYTGPVAEGTPPDVYKYSLRVKGLSPVDPWVANY